jgi:Camelysin metallo-endopeptidase
MTRRRKILATLLLAVVIGGVAGPATFSAFSKTTASSGNLFTAGTVHLDDNDGGSSALLSLTNAKPGDSDTGCIRVNYGGTLDAGVRLYANVSGSLAQYLTLTVTRGNDLTPSFDSCLTFVPDLLDYIGQGSGVIYSGTLSAFPGSYAAGLVDPDTLLLGSPETWASPEAHSYKFTISLASNDAAQGLNGSADFTWEARNQ